MYGVSQKMGVFKKVIIFIYDWDNPIILPQTYLSVVFVSRKLLLKGAGVAIA
jgi:hypothetical protein